MENMEIERETQSLDAPLSGVMMLFGGEFGGVVVWDYTNWEDHTGPWSWLKILLCNCKLQMVLYCMNSFRFRLYPLHIKAVRFIHRGGTWQGSGRPAQSSRSGNLPPFHVTMKN
jgi:hypothetical protein